MPPRCSLNAKQAEDEEKLLAAESEQVLLAHSGILMNADVQRYAHTIPSPWSIAIASSGLCGTPCAGAAGSAR